MIDFSWSHILILLIVGLVVVGPKDLPRLMRMIGQWMGKAREMADQFKRSFDDMARQSELDELRKEIESLRGERPLAGLEEDLHQSILPDDMVDPIPGPESVHVDPPADEGEPPPHEPAIAEPAIPEVAAAGYTPPAP